MSVYAVCPKCLTHEILDSAKEFCRICGAKLLKTCAHCHAEIEPYEDPGEDKFTEYFCRNCGTQFTGK